MTITWEFLKSLDELYGASFYLLDLDKFTDRYTRFLQAFRDTYPHTQIAYSYKTNYAPAICKQVNELGGLAEVVSPMEYELAVRIGVSSEKIIVNGPYKPKDFMERALADGAVVHLDHFHDIDMVCSLAAATQERPMRVGIRCNLDLGTDSRFGFDEQQVGEAFSLLGRFANVAVEGLHFHMCTRERDVGTYVGAAQQLISIAAACTTGPLRYIDMGGGFFSPMSDDLRSQFPGPVPSFEDYGAAIADVFRRHFPAGETQLILEPGLAITADVMQFVARAVAEKSLRGKTHFVVAGSIYNIKPTKSAINLPLTVVGKSPPGATEAFDIVGYTCMEDDVLYRGCRQEIYKDDYVVFDNAGAYSVVLKPPFIHPCPPIICYDEQSGPSLVKRAEAMDDVFSAYAF
jgi:diaminopimelate decarboxylase